MEKLASRLPWVLWVIAAVLTMAILPYVVDEVIHVLEERTDLPGWARPLFVSQIGAPLLGLVVLLPAVRRPRVAPAVIAIVLGMVPLGAVLPTASLGAGLLGMRIRHPLPVVLVAGIAGAGLGWCIDPIPDLRSKWFDGVPMTLSLVSATLFGMLLRGQQQLAEARVTQSRAEERARISREMHDSLAHRLSLISLHATALGNRTDLAPDVVARTAATIQTMTAEAGRELRQILQVLHDDDSGRPPSSPGGTWRGSCSGRTTAACRSRPRSRPDGSRPSRRRTPGPDTRSCAASRNCSATPGNTATAAPRSPSR
ncbi:MAG: histidine kinase [Arachnia propionica]|uniref:sensor histidine kinase n=1 Tax=Arachnia propionica TaxID=1750 RepID=UPI002709CC77|nr:histidine kinase [Arachnia propionica]